MSSNTNIYDVSNSYDQESNHFENNPENNPENHNGNQMSNIIDNQEETNDYLNEFLNLFNGNIVPRENNDIIHTSNGDYSNYNNIVIPRVFDTSTAYLMEFTPLTNLTRLSHIGDTQYSILNNIYGNNEGNNGMIDPIIRGEPSNNLQDFINETLLTDNPKYKVITSEKGKNEIIKGSYHDTMEYNECPITREEFKNGDIILILPCNHYFTPAEINIWLDESNKCPICRYELDGVEVKIKINNIQDDVAISDISRDISGDIIQQQETYDFFYNMSNIDNNLNIPHSYIQLL